MERIYRYQFKWNYLKNHTLSSAFTLHSWYLHEIPNVLKKTNEPHRSSIFEVIYSEGSAHLNLQEGFFPQTL